MRIRYTLTIIGIVLLVVSAAAYYFSGRQTNTASPDEFNESLMRLESPAFGQQEEIPSRYTCDDENLLPPLNLIKIPEEAVSLAFIVDDPDAPVGTFTHWLAWNVPADVTEIREGEPPVGVQGTTDFGTIGWGGPCPPSGSHRYFFKVFALDTMLDLPAGAGVKELESAMNGHVIDKAGLVGLYERRR